MAKFGIYVIFWRKKVLRVGESKSGKTRLKKGFCERLYKRLRGKKRKNYIAFAWRAKYRQKRLIVDYFELTATSFACDHYRRALEAELTFQFRIARKQWPSEMSEIHFLERYRTKSVLIQTAAAILTHYGITYDKEV